MATDIIRQYSQEKRLSAEQYVEILDELGGDATTREIADASGRRQETVSRTLGQHFDADAVEDIGGVLVEKTTRGATHVYEIVERAPDEENSTDE